MRIAPALLSGALAVGVIVPATIAAEAAHTDRPSPRQAGHSFERIAHFPVFHNNGDAADETVAEIIDATDDGMTLVYADAETESMGFVDITDPEAPTPGGTVALAGEPTSVAVLGDLALVGVNTSASLTEPSGHVAVIDIATRTVVEQVPLGGQPDAVAASPAGEYAAVAIENERDEDITVDGVEGGLPQQPAGLLQVIDTDGAPADWQVRDVALTGLAEYGADDPEPEFVDINADDEAVVTLQENNHLVVVDLPTGEVVNDFSAGTVDLDQVDTVEDDVITLDGSLRDVPREPDAVGWINGGMFATANEGDLFGGTRGFTIFNKGGKVMFDVGNAFEHEVVRAGHYPESRSENKGAEIEGIEVGRYDATTYLFVGAERANVVGVYSMKGPKAEFVQVLPAGMGPEGMKAIEYRGLFVATSEVDDPTYGVRTNISIYRLADGAPAYPEIASADSDAGTPIPWGALSGLVADPERPGTVLAVSDSYYAQGQIFVIDTTEQPARITDVTTVTGAEDLDLEGITVAPDGTRWLASEGNADDSRENRLLQVDADGAVMAEIGLPKEVLDCRAGGGSALGSGFEGVTVVPRDGGYVLAVAQQRGWTYDDPACADLGDAPGFTRVWFCDPATGEWTHQSYELEPTPEHAAWVGLSEITSLDNGDFLLIERDNRTGEWAEFKALTRVDLSSPVTSAAKEVADLIGPMSASGGWISDKPEGGAVLPDGSVVVVTDNDGVDGWSGETQFLRLGMLGELF